MTKSCVFALGVVTVAPVSAFFNDHVMETVSPCTGGLLFGKDNDKYSARYIGEGEGKIGPFPGMVVGGVNGSMKKYVDKLDWRTNPWEFNEPDITYQSPCATLLAYFALKVK